MNFATLQIESPQGNTVVKLLPVNPRLKIEPQLREIVMECGGMVQTVIERNYTMQMIGRDRASNKITVTCLQTRIVQVRLEALYHSEWKPVYTVTFVTVRGSCRMYTVSARRFFWLCEIMRGWQMERRFDAGRVSLEGGTLAAIYGRLW